MGHSLGNNDLLLAISSRRQLIFINSVELLFKIIIIDGP